MREEGTPSQKSSTTRQSSTPNSSQPNTQTVSLLNIDVIRMIFLALAQAEIVCNTEDKKIIGENPQMLLCAIKTLLGGDPQHPDNIFLKRCWSAILKNKEPQQLASLFTYAKDHITDDQINQLATVDSQSISSFNRAIVNLGMFSFGHIGVQSRRNSTVPDNDNFKL